VRAFLFSLLIGCTGSDDLELAYIVAAECLQCDPEEKEMVANVVINRMEHGDYPDQVSEVISQKGQFHGYCSGWYVYDLESHRAAVRAKRSRKYKNIYYFWRGKRPEYVKRIEYKMRYHNFGQ